MSIHENQTWQGTKFERNATKFFAIVALISISIFSASFYPQERVVLSVADNPNFVAIHEKRAQFKSITENPFRGKSAERSFSLFKFDPNTATKDELTQLGLSPKLAQTILNFRSKNGKFYQPKDLQKIYGFRSEDYERLKDYVQIGEKKKKAQFVKYSSEKVAIEYFKFDPNEATKEEFVRLGLSPKIAKRITNYRSKGGKFKQKEDLKRIYDFSEEDYARLEAYIFIAEQKSEKTVVKVNFPEKESSPNTFEQIKIDINQSTAEDWEQLRGIGPKYAKKILNFRDKLGGFSSIEQVGTTYYFPDSVFQKVKPYLILSPVLQRINVNSANEKELNAHPYINWKQAKSWVAYRKQHGEFESLKDLKKIYGVFSEEDWVRLTPYLTF